MENSVTNTNKNKHKEKFNSLSLTFFNLFIINIQSDMVLFLYSGIKNKKNYNNKIIVRTI